MRAGIIDFGVGVSQWTGKRAKNTLSQGPNIVRRICLEAGLDVIDLHAKWEPVDVIMVGMFWWEHLYDLVALLAAHGVEPHREQRKGKPLVFVGGQLPSYNPSMVSNIADLVCIGDGEEAAPAALKLLFAGAPPSEWSTVPGIYVSAVDNCAEWQQVDDISSTIRWPFRNRVMTTHESGVKQEENFEHRLEIARGCRRKCAFCGVSWTKKYRENPAEMLAEAIKTIPGAVKAFAPDPRAHSHWAEIDQAYVDAGKYNQARDVSTRIILQEGFGRTRIYATGIDGISERVRAALSKPLSVDEAVEVFEMASAHAGELIVCQVLDLPGENRDDYLEWGRTMCKIKVHTRVEHKRFLGRPGDFYIVMHLNMFCPTPHTPLAWEGITVDSPAWSQYQEALDMLGPKEDRQLKHKLVGRPHGSVSRILESAALRGDVDLGPLIFPMSHLRHKLTTAGEVFEVARRLGVRDQLIATTQAHDPAKEVMSWERRVKPLFPRAALLGGRAKYRRMMGLPV